jgi:hypothetical protein
MSLLGSAALAIWWDIAPQVLADFEDWHSHEHFTERLGIPGFRRVTRWRDVAGGAGIFVMYELDDHAVLSSAPYLARLNAPTPWSTRMMPNHRNMIRSQCRVLESAGGAVARHALTVRLSPEPGRPATSVFFGGPYKDAPYSMVFAVPAQAGAFDLGTIVVRAGVYIHPTTTQVTVKSDPLPSILEGVSIEYRDVRVEIRKPDFTINPTSCDVKRFEATVTSNVGQTAHPSARFQVADCASLPFGPKLAFRLKGGTNRGDYPALTATLTARPGEANIAKAAVTLPRSEFLAQEHIRTICTRVQFASRTCPEASIYGKAKAVSPLIDGALEGPVYLRSSSNPLPDLVADLNGAFNVVLAGRIDSVNQGIRNTFDLVPDAPVSSFTLSMQGGRKGLLVNSRNLCKSVNRAQVRLVGQNGKLSKSSPAVANSCRKAGKPKRAKR